MQPHGLEALHDVVLDQPKAWEQPEVGKAFERRVRLPNRGGAGAAYFQAPAPVALNIRSGHTTGAAALHGRGGGARLP